MRAILSPGTQFWERQPVFHMSCPKVEVCFALLAATNSFPCSVRSAEMQWGQRRWEQPHRVFWSVNLTKIFPFYCLLSFEEGRSGGDKKSQLPTAKRGNNEEVGNALAGWLRAVFTSKDMSSHCIASAWGVPRVPLHCADCSVPPGWCFSHRKILFQK